MNALVSRLRRFLVIQQDFNPQQKSLPSLVCFCLKCFSVQFWVGRQNRRGAKWELYSVPIWLYEMELEQKLFGEKQMNTAWCWTKTCDPFCPPLLRPVSPPPQMGCGQPADQFCWRSILLFCLYRQLQGFHSVAARLHFLGEDLLRYHNPNNIPKSSFTLSYMPHRRASFMCPVILSC